MTVLRDRTGTLPCNARVEGGLVVSYDKHTRPHGAEWIDYGLSAYSATVFAGPGPGDLADVQHTLAAAGELAAYEAEHRFYEIGTPEALLETERFLASPSNS
jgi:NDP-sugar pyrophosphorylase family protein